MCAARSLTASRAAGRGTTGGRVRRLALLVVNHARWVIVAAILFVVVAAVIGSNVADKLSAGGFEDPNSESVKAAADLLSRFPAAGEPDFVVLVTARGGSVDDAAVSDAATALTDTLAKD